MARTTRARLEAVDPTPPDTTGNQENAAQPPDAPASNGADGSPRSPGDVFDQLERSACGRASTRCGRSKPLTTVGIRKPKKHEWFQAHPEYRYEGTLFEEQAEGISKEWSSRPTMKCWPSWRISQLRAQERHHLLVDQPQEEHVHLARGDAGQ